MSGLFRSLIQKMVKVRPKDDKLEALRSQWMRATDSEARQEIAAAIQERAFEIVPYIPTGQWKTRTAYRKNLKGLVLGPVIFQWGVEKGLKGAGDPSPDLLGWL